MPQSISLENDPEFLAIQQRFPGGGSPLFDHAYKERAQAVGELVAKRGLQLPDGFNIDSRTGRLERTATLGRWAATQVLPALGGALTFGALSGAGAATGLASSAGGGGAAGGAAAASSIPGWVGPAIKIGGAAAIGGLSRSGGGNRSNTQTGLPPDVEAQLLELLQSQQRQRQRQEPVHQAAMQLAMRMSQGSAVGGPRLQQATQDAMTPRPQQAQDPQVADAIARLMGGR